METISTVASTVVTTATKVIWGERKPAAATGNETAGNETAGQEPVSGLQGKGTVEEPFDQGNAANPNSQATAASSIDPISNSTSNSKSNPSTSAMSDSTTSAPRNLNNAATGGTPDPLANTEGTGVTGSSAQKFTPSGGDVVPSEASNNPGAAPASGAAPSQKQQGADRPQEAPSDAPAREDSPEALLKKRNPNDHSGEPMRVHSESEKVPETQAERRESKVGNPGGQEHGTDEPKGTGEKWVKSTGLAADGGDFDATKPGAGREADRILEEKGIHKDAKGAMDNPTAAGSSSPERKEKISKLGKIKDKLHIKEKLHIGHRDK